MDYNSAGNHFSPSRRQAGCDWLEREHDVLVKCGASGVGWAHIPILQIIY